MVKLSNSQSNLGIFSHFYVSASALNIWVCVVYGHRLALFDSLKTWIKKWWIEKQPKTSMDEKSWKRQAYFRTYIGYHTRSNVIFYEFLSLINKINYIDKIIFLNFESKTE